MPHTRWLKFCLESVWKRRKQTSVWLGFIIWRFLFFQLLSYNRNCFGKRELKLKWTEIEGALRSNLVKLFHSNLWTRQQRTVDSHFFCETKSLIDTNRFYRRSLFYYRLWLIFVSFSFELWLDDAIIANYNMSFFTQLFLQYFKPLIKH